MTLGSASVGGGASGGGDASAMVSESGGGGGDHHRVGMLEPLLEEGDNTALIDDWAAEGAHDLLADSASMSSDEDGVNGFGSPWSSMSSRRLRTRSQSESFIMQAVNSNKHDKPLGWMGICFITYFNVSGGPWGSEELISSMGPLPGLLGLAAFAVMWALPLVMVTAELSSAFPDDGGYSIWVAEAFGTFWGFQEAYWSWLSGVIDTAIYPVLAFDTAAQILRGDWSKPIDGGDSGDIDPDWLKYCNNTVTPSTENNFWSFADGDSLGSENEPFGTKWYEEYLVKLGMVLVFALPNICGAKSFGRGMTLLACLVILPFAFQSIYVVATQEIKPARLLESREHGTMEDWAQLISVLYWNLSGFDAASTCAGEVRNPGRSYPRGLFAALALVLTTYVIPLTVFTMANKPDWHCWDEGWFSVIGQKQVGQGMALWIVIVSFAANAGMYTAEVFEDSWQLCGMARTGLMPSIFGARKDGTGSPYVSIAFALCVISALVALDFNAIVVISNLFSCLSAMLELVAFLKLRLVQPDLRRPYRLPIENMTLLALYVSVPILLGGVVVATSLISWISILINGVALIVGMMLYHGMQRQGHIQYFYESSSPATPS
ncbi:Amino acid-polyamine transporter, putative [Hondaea fermentalgiana]|uniref:Amino acid-polyamine transporter, putative n=1 Tax=Hondaea fermentalgiana TaxID=2315210 RepID=A0A2R5G8K3_9STRA|nr:Amino acid-polyamine transporter, putative [Hondaea fermentalgiana]|eukprot:GBG26108.1 Amino acid-polyamine transporter, putative [Hondaea fermentalgiana]